ncbi:hypothetical protein SOVF_107190 [Spinacia oleracea]|nr:hypothetical protein SOVF_107190 [Spinacia oleracea]
MDFGRCTCIIMKETARPGFGGGSLYSLSTDVNGWCSNMDCGIGRLIVPHVN